MRPLPPLTALRAFDAAARHLSFTQAAEELHVTRGAISQQIKTLEQWLGMQLFARVKTSLLLTPEGKEYFETVRAGLEILKSGTERINRRKRNCHLLLSVSLNFSFSYLLPRLYHFEKIYPEIEISINSGMEYVDLGSGFHDVAIRHGSNPGEWPHAIELAKEKIVPVCSPAAITYGGPIRSVDDLAKHQLLDYSGRENWSMWAAMAGIALPKPASRVNFDNPSLVVQAAIHGHGIGLSRTLLVLDPLLKGLLIRPLPTVVAAPFGFYLVPSSSALRKREVKLFRDWLVEETTQDVKRLHDILGV